MKRSLYIFVAILVGTAIWVGIAVLTFDYQPDMVHNEDGGQLEVW